MDGAGGFEFLFGPAIAREEWESAGPDGRRELIETRFPDRRGVSETVRAAVVDQLVSGKPPHVWETAQRLADDGATPDEVLSQLSMVLTHRAAADGSEAGGVDEAGYQSRLDRLPLPSASAIEPVLLELAAAARVMPTGELVAATSRSLGSRDDDPLIANMVELVEEDLATEAGPLVWLPGDRTAHVATLCDGSALTHALTEAERSAGVLDVSFDLAGFGRFEKLSFAGLAIEPDAVDPGHVAWIGPARWLDRFEAGTVLAVRVDHAGEIYLEPLAAAPPVDPGLVAAVRRSYDQVVEELELPVSGEELVFGVLAEDRAAFATPQAPLNDLCQAATLERRGSAAAHHPDIWANEWIFGRMRRVTSEAGDTDLADRVLDILDLTDELASSEAGEDGEVIDGDRVRGALDAMADLEVLDLVVDELFNEVHPLRGADILVSRLLDAADRPPQRAAAHLIAAMAAEVTGDVVAAEQHLEVGVGADPTNVPATDRLAWYASDRGEAARAARLWRRCPRSAAIGQDLASIEPLLRSATAGLGRNDRCWCGSGRKYKQCHLGVAAPTPLPDRVGWLCRKAVGYLERIGPAARAAVLDVVYARIDDDDGIAAAMDDPLVMDLVLTEGQWFGRFLADRSELLPDDEAMLAASWMTVQRTVYEIIATTAGVGLRVRDLRTGHELDVREPTFSRSDRIGTLVCGRAVPDGDTNQLIGGVFPVAPGTETALFDLLDEGDPQRIASWVRELQWART